MSKDNTLEVGILIVALIFGILSSSLIAIVIEKNNNYKFISEMASKGYEQILIDKQLIWKKVSCE